MTTENIPKLLRKYVIQELPTDNREWEILMFDTADEIERLWKAGDALAQGIRTGRWDDALDEWDKVRGNG